MKKERKTDAHGKLKKEKRKLFFLCVGGFLASALPLFSLLVLRWDTYTSVPGGAVRLCFGGAAIALLILLKVLGKIKLPSRLCVMGISLVLVYLLEGLLADLTLILWVALIGEATDALFFAPLAKKTRKRIEVACQADATADRVEELLKTYAGGKR